MDYKKRSFNVPLSARQREKVGEAARLESERRGVIMTATALFREIAMAGIEDILALEWDSD